MQGRRTAPSHFDIVNPLVMKSLFVLRFNSSRPDWENNEVTLLL